MNRLLAYNVSKVSSMWVTVFDSDFIEISVVYTESYCFVSFPN